MEIKTTIVCADGGSAVCNQSSSARDCLEFLKVYDHEGSKVEVKIKIDDATRVYKVLKSIAAMESNEISANSR